MRRERSGCGYLNCLADRAYGERDRKVVALAQGDFDFRFVRSGETRRGNRDGVDAGGYSVHFEVAVGASDRRADGTGGFVLNAYGRIRQELGQSDPARSGNERRVRLGRELYRRHAPYENGTAKGTYCNEAFYYSSQSSQAPKIGEWAPW